MIQKTLAQIRLSEKQIKIFLIEQSETLQLGLDEEGYPLIACWKIDDYHYAFYCRFCKMIHKHGLGDGHRASHCFIHNINSPMAKSGYNLVFQGDLTK